MNGTRPDAWSVQTGIDLDAMLAANGVGLNGSDVRPNVTISGISRYCSECSSRFARNMRLVSVPVRIGLRKTCNWLRALSTEVCASLFPVGLRKRF